MKAKVRPPDARYAAKFGILELNTSLRSERA